MELQQVILVNEQDEVMGTMEKMEAHRKGALHRAFSVFIFNARGEMLLHQRALNKYHSGGLWTNTCCSHPQPDEEMHTSAKRRLQEEMGFAIEPERIFEFIYRAEFNNGMTEHEFDYVLAGEYEGPVSINKEEVMDYCYKSMDDVRRSLEQQPQKFTQWFHLSFPRIEQWWHLRYLNRVA